MMGGDRKIWRFEDIVGWQKARELVKVICEVGMDRYDRTS